MDKKDPLEDDEKEKILLLVEHRLPWLIIGLGGGIATAFFTSRFEEILTTNISLAYFIPVIVYMADAVGSQTETIYIRNLGKRRVNFWVYLFKELLLGSALGLLFGLILGGVSWYFFLSVQTAFTIGLTVFISVATAPIIALCISGILYKEGKDPALGAAPFITITQDVITLLLYFAVASLIIIV